MIAGVGVDIIEICRIEKAAASDRFYGKVFTEEERRCLESRGKGRVQSLAGAFAAKEAAAKALGCGFRGFGPKDIEVWHEESGAPRLRFFHKAQERAEQLQVTAVHVSISHDQTRAIAFVILEKGASD